MMPNETDDVPYVNFSIRLTTAQVEQIEQIARAAKGGIGRVTRSSLIRNWIERGIRASKRPR
jgi:5,10-methylene-tetrahydrofolate dehydrogenase/methenyl tetrahydrofolate cyclohydrolase